MRFRLSVSLLLGLLRLPAPVEAQSAEARFTKAFDERDREAQALVWTMDCTQRTGAARGRGLFGPVDSVGRYGVCTRVGGALYGVFLETDTTFAAATNVRVLDLREMQRSATSIDTAALLSELRARMTALRRSSANFAAEQRRFTPFSYRDDDGTIHVWLLPIAVLSGTALGGERWWIFSADGRTEVSAHDASDRWRTVTLGEARTVVIRSQEAEIPLLSEMVLANLLARSGRTTTIQTSAYSSTLWNDRWVQAKNSP
jgi:hypothetical protein